MEAELESSGMGRDTILEYMGGNWECFFVLFNILRQLADMIIKHYINIQFNKY